jgi:high-affinity nickel-transport protein
MADAPPAGAVPASSAPLLPSERALAVGLYLAIGAATLAAVAAIGLVARTYPVFIGLGAVSYILGLRHGVDADHICAIDNTTRKLLQDGERPLTVGTWFSLGHSTVVVGLIVGLVLAVDTFSKAVPALQSTGFLIGTAASGVFLYAIALVNLLIAIEIYRLFRALRAGTMDYAALEENLAKRGFMNRYFGGLFRLVRRPWQMYPVGVLFGLGFDTATEVAVIALALRFGTGSGAVPIGFVLLLPVLFTLGMVLTDTSDGITMRYAYGWAFRSPLRKVYYNLTITVISVLVAFAVGTFEVLGVVATELGLTGGAWSFVNYVNGEASWEYLGFVIVGLFVVAWLVALAVYRWRRYEERGLGPRPPPGAEDRAPVPAGPP